MKNYIYYIYNYIIIYNIAETEDHFLQIKMGLKLKTWINCLSKCQEDPLFLIPWGIRGSLKRHTAVVAKVAFYLASIKSALFTQVHTPMARQCAA